MSSASASAVSDVRPWTLVDSPVGPLLVSGDEHGLRELRFVDPQDVASLEDRPGRDDAAFSEAATQLRQYFAGERTTFDLALAPEGTDFQLAVWAQLRAIPHGETRTYGEIAEALGKPSAQRAVGLANGRNPIAVVVPCHRVIGADGSLTGFAGGVERKRILLDLERGVVPLI